MVDKLRQFHLVQDKLLNNLANYDIEFYLQKSYVLREPKVVRREFSRMNVPERRKGISKIKFKKKARYLCPFMRPFITESSCFFENIFVAWQKTDNIAIGDTQTVVIIIDFEYPSLNIEMFDY